MKSFEKDSKRRWESAAVPNYTIQLVLSFRSPPWPGRRRSKTHRRAPHLPGLQRGGALAAGWSAPCQHWPGFGQCANQIRLCCVTSVTTSAKYGVESSRGHAAEP